MEIKLWKKPKNCTIIEGFPGFGLVGTIASEFLMEHLKTEQIGKILFDDMPAMVAIHENRLVEPLGIFYNQKYNIVILHAITATTHFEWKMASLIGKLASDLQAKEIISLEGVGSGEDSDGTRVFYYSNNEKNSKLFEKAGISPLKEGIIIGVTGAILLRVEKTPISCLFAETHSNLPDSKAAAKVLEALDKYIGIELDTKPLLEQAEKFEQKLKTILQKSQEAQEISDKKKLSYLG
ncbi:proteasome assembly chaperone family protein [Candidatus Woesearchaeota archaeon]|nr:proteasome assembly chaperone family protein [Candidatus Woesearchaeota archaeon]